MKGERKRVVRIVLVVVLLLLAGAGFKIYEDVFASNVSDDTVLYCRSTQTSEENLEGIRTQRVLRNFNAFKRLIALSGYTELIRPGRYVLKAGTSNLEILRLLVSGRQQPVDIVFKSGERLHDVCAFWGKNLEADSTTLEQLTRSPMIYDSLGLDAENAIQLFVPNTYNFFWTTSAESLINRMMKEYRRFWDSTRTRQAERLTLTPAEVGVLASIVQKETARRDEMPVIAGVYWNRLQRGMPLGADPTILFVLNDKSIRRVAGEMLNIESPYNTYRNKGLPPGPICVASVQAIDAVLNMHKHNYLYFCAKEDFSGYHSFSASFDQHLIHARRYQRALNQKGIK